PRPHADGPPKQSTAEPTVARLTLAEGRFGQALDARKAPAVSDSNLRFGAPPLTVECWVRLSSKAGVNTLVSNDSPSSSSHWRIYTVARTGEFCAHLAGTQPSEIRSKDDVC